jgi:hypothetical protein
MNLRQTIKTIRRLKQWNQRKLAGALEIEDQQTVSEMENAGPTWEKHWRIFLKLLPLCRELKIDLMAPEEVINDDEPSRKKPN